MKTIVVWFNQRYSFRSASVFLEMEQFKTEKEYNEWAEDNCAHFKITGNNMKIEEFPYIENTHSNRQTNR